MITNFWKGIFIYFQIASLCNHNDEGIIRIVTFSTFLKIWENPQRLLLFRFLRRYCDSYYYRITFSTTLIKILQINLPYSQFTCPLQLIFHIAKIPTKFCISINLHDLLTNLTHALHFKINNKTPLLFRFQFPLKIDVAVICDRRHLSTTCVYICFPNEKNHTHVLKICTFPRSSLAFLPLRIRLIIFSKKKN